MRDWRHDSSHYLRALLSEECSDWVGLMASGGDNPFKVVDSIVWVTRETWYPEDTDFSGFHPSAKPTRLDVRITIYKEPKKGWRQLYRIADPLKNVKLYGWRLMPGPNLRDSFREAIYDRLNQLAQEFQQKVWELG